MTIEPAIDVLNAEGFSAYVDSCVEIYVVAMRKGRDVVQARRSITRRHLDHPGLRAVIASCDDGLVAFSYGYHGERGQWWHDAVSHGLSHAEADHWLSNAFEVAEVHVLPAWQGRGIGRRVLTMLLDGVTESTVVLSAIDDETPARHLYRSLGFRDLKTAFRFPGSSERYAVMARPLPLD